MIDHLSELIECSVTNWQFEIGDPHLLGWMTVFGYAAALTASFFSIVEAHRAGRPKLEIYFWYYLIFILLFLMINKQIDLQTLLTTIAKCEAKLTGWYENRRNVQVSFILALSSFVITLSIITLTAFKTSLQYIWSSMLGVTIIKIFVIARAAESHKVDLLNNPKLLIEPYVWILEILGILCILIGAILTAIRYKTQYKSKISQIPKFEKHLKPR